jgi:hypothetical protein
LGFGIFEPSEAPVKIRDCLFEHRAMRSGARRLQVGERPSASKR